MRYGGYYRGRGRGPGPRGMGTRNYIWLWQCQHLSCAGWRAARSAGVPRARKEIKSKTLSSPKSPKILSNLESSIFNILETFTELRTLGSRTTNAGERREGRRGRLHDRADASPRRRKCDTAASTGAEGGVRGPRAKGTRNYVWLWQCQHSSCAGWRAARSAGVPRRTTQLARHHNSPLKAGRLLCADSCTCQRTRGSRGRWTTTPAAGRQGRRACSRRASRST